MSSASENVLKHRFYIGFQLLPEVACSQVSLCYFFGGLYDIRVHFEGNVRAVCWLDF